MIKTLFLKNNVILIGRIEEVPSELGEPDCKLIKPFVLTETGLIPWMNEFTNQTEMMIHSDSILTIVDPNKDYLNKYQSLTVE
jgi:hypothetical protein